MVIISFNCFITVRDCVCECCRVECAENREENGKRKEKEQEKLAPGCVYSRMVGCIRHYFLVPTALQLPSHKPRYTHLNQQNPNIPTLNTTQNAKERKKLQQKAHIAHESTERQQQREISKTKLKKRGKKEVQK